MMEQREENQLKNLVQESNLLSVRVPLSNTLHLFFPFFVTSSAHVAAACPSARPWAAVATKQHHITVSDGHFHSAPRVFKHFQTNIRMEHRRRCRWTGGGHSFIDSSSSSLFFVLFWRATALAAGLFFFFVKKVA